MALFLFCVHVCACKCVCVYMHVEIRGQCQVLFLRCGYLFMRQGLLCDFSKQARLDYQRAPCVCMSPNSTAIRMCAICLAFLFYCEFLGSNSGRQVCKIFGLKSRPPETWRREGGQEGGIEIMTGYINHPEHLKGISNSQVD